MSFSSFSISLNIELASLEYNQGVTSIKCISIKVVCNLTNARSSSLQYKGEKWNWRKIYTNQLINVSLLNNKMVSRQCVIQSYSNANILGCLISWSAHIHYFNTRFRLSGFRGSANREHLIFKASVTGFISLSLDNLNIKSCVYCTMLQE